MSFILIWISWFCSALLDRCTLSRIVYDRFLADTSQFVIRESLRHLTRRKSRKHFFDEISRSLVSIKVEEYADHCSDYQLHKKSVLFSRLDIYLVRRVDGVREPVFVVPCQ